MEDWEKILDNQYYGEINKLSDSDLWKFCRGSAVGDLFRSCLSSQKQKIKRKIEEWIETSRREDFEYEEGDNSEIMEIKGRLQGYVEKYNEALSDLQEYLKTI